MDTIGYTLRLPDELRRQAKVAAAERDISMNTWVVEAIREKLGEKTMSNTNVLESPDCEWIQTRAHQVE